MKTLKINLGKSGTMPVNAFHMFNYKGQQWFIHESHDTVGELTVSHYTSGYRALRIPRYFVGTYRGEMIKHARAKLDAIPQGTFDIAVERLKNEVINP